MIRPLSAYGSQALGPARMLAASAAASAALLAYFLCASIEGRSMGALGTAGTLVSGPALSRAELLAFMWGPEFSGPIVTATSLALLALCIAGAAALLKPRGPVGTGLGAFVLCAGLAGNWALLTPPLQAPDEADQFLGFFERPFPSTVARPDVLAWANRMHFERIKFRRNQGLNGAYVDTPLTGGWAAHIAPVEMHTRAPLTFLAWQGLARAFSGTGLSAGVWLLLLRSVNALALAAALSLACGALAAMARTPPGGERRQDPIAFLVPLLLIPTFFFFAVHVSNYGFFMAGMAVFCAGIFAGLEDADRGAVHEGAVGLLVGGGMAIAMLSTRSALPMASILGFLVVARILFGTRSLGRTVVFWLGIGVSMLAILQLADAAYREKLDEGLREVLASRNLPGASFSSMRIALVGLAITLPGLEALIGFVRQRLSARFLLADGARAFYGVAIGLSACVLVAANISPGALADNEIRHPLLGLTYVRPVTLRFVDQLFPLSIPDFFLASSFWGGFGWLDRLLPAPIVFFIKMAPLAGLAACGVHAARHPLFRPVFLRMATLCVAAVTLVAVNAYLVSWLVRLPGDPPLLAI
ncbi:MAG: hypothetical protein ABI630_10420, partial [Betaproteobacteria bacterium]